MIQKRSNAHTIFLAQRQTDFIFWWELNTNFHLWRSHQSRKTINYPSLHLIQWISIWNSIIYNPFKSLMCDFLNLDTSFVGSLYKKYVGYNIVVGSSFSFAIVLRLLGFFLSAAVLFFLFVSLVFLRSTCRRLSQLICWRKFFNTSGKFERKVIFICIDWVKSRCFF